jgi:YbbR domain-containing protein
LALVAYGVLAFLNSPKGLRYIGLVLLGALILTVSSFWRLPGLHVVSQAIILILLVSFPIIFHERWSQLLSGAAPTTAGHFSKMTLATLAVVVSLLAVFLGSGGLVKIAELPSEISVRAVNLPLGMTANFGSGDSARIIVSAPRDIWGQLNEGNFSATVDAANRGEGTYDVDIVVTSQIDNVRVVRVNPQKALITVEPVIKKTVPVSIKVSGKAGNELVAGQALVEPEKVEIAGPKALINEISQVYGEIALNGETEKVNLPAVELFAVTGTGDKLNSIEITPGTAKVSLPLVKAGNSKSVPVHPVVSGSPAVGYWVESVIVEPAVIAVQGSAEALISLKSVTTEAISLQGINKTTTQTVKLSLPSGVTTTEDISAVTVTITVSKVDTTKSLTPEIVYDGLSASLKVSSTNPITVATVISGPASLLNTVSGSDVKLRLNLASYKSPGTYSVAIDNSFFDLPNGVSLASFLPSAIDVTLENR